MEKILLVFLNDLEREEEFDELIDKFSQNDYNVYMLDNIKEDEYFSFDSLPELVESYRNECYKQSKVVVLSNARDLLFAWYRCYNSITDDLVYFIDEDDKNYFDVNERHLKFFKSLSNFDSIEKEKIKDKIYMNINFNNYDKIINFLLTNNNSLYFNSLEEFNYTATKKMKNNNLSLKRYIYSGYKYEFAILSLESHKDILLENKDKDELDYTVFLNNIAKSWYLTPYMTTSFYKTKNKNITYLLVNTYKNLKEIDISIQKKIFNKLYSYIKNSDIDFKEKIYISSLLVMINNSDERLTELMMKTLLEDYNYIEHHYEILANILFYHSNENLALHFNYYLDLRNEISKLAEWSSKDIKIKKHEVRNQNKKIAIITDQLLSLNHSPTKLTLDYAKNIKKYYPEYTVKIFVEDSLYCKDELNIIPYLYTTVISETIMEEHYNYIDDKSIEICYANVGLSKRNRTITLLKEMTEFQPDGILTNSDISLISRIYYGKCPITYMSLGGDYFSNFADSYLCISKEIVLKENLKYNLFNHEKLYTFKYGLQFSNAKKKLYRDDYSISENDFVMITVGNRLDTEIDEDFIDNITKFIILNKDVKWIIVGSKTIQYIEKNHKKLLGNKILKIEYESDLPALYKICDVYINPRRKGGGISIAMAMNEGLPIIITEDSTDGVSYTGNDYAVKNMKEYIVCLDKMMQKPEYRQFISKEMNLRISKYNMKSSIDKILNTLSIGKEYNNE